MSVFADAIGWLLAVFYSLVPNLGISIVLLTCAVMLAIFPLTAKQTRSMIALQRAQPEIKRIQTKYKDDKQKQNEEIMRFYQENKINPLSGCLPLLIQMPIMFSLYTVVRNPQDYVPDTGQFSDLFVDLCGSTPASKCSPHVDFLGMDLLQSANKVSGGFLDLLPYIIGIALVVITGWYQAYQTMARRQSQGAAPPNSQQKMMTYLFPAMFGWFSYITPAGLVVYFLTGNLWRIGQQQLVLNKYYTDDAAGPGGAIAAKATEPDQASGAKKSPTPPPRRRKKRKR